MAFDTLTFQAGVLASGTAGISVAPPADVVDGDMLVLCCEMAAQGFATPAGWAQGQTILNGTAGVAGSVGLKTFYKYASGVQAAVSVADSGDHTTGVMVRVRGIEQGDDFSFTFPYDTPASGSITPAATNWTISAISPTFAASRWALLIMANDLDLASTNNITSVTNANIGTFTRLFDETVAAGTGGGLSIWYAGPIANSGTTGTTAVVSSTSNTAAYLMLPLIPQVLADLMGQACL